MRYDDERFGFDGEAGDVDGYFTRENFVAMFGSCDESDDDLAALREQAHDALGYDPEADAELEAERDGQATKRLTIRTLSRCPGGDEWQWTEACDADAPEGATVADYVETMHDGCADTHIGVYLVADMDPREAASLGVEDIRGAIHYQRGALVAWVPLDGPVTYELVEE